MTSSMFLLMIMVWGAIVGTSTLFIMADNQALHLAIISVASLVLLACAVARVKVTY